jgi:hypothetical protein
MGNTVKLIAELVQKMVSGMDGSSSILTRDFSAGISDTFFQFISQLLENAIQPLAYMLLALFFLTELSRISMRIESAGGTSGLGAEIVFKTLFRFAIFKLVLDSVPVILRGMYAISVYLIGKIDAVSAAINSNADTAANIVKPSLEIILTGVSGAMFFQMLTAIIMLAVVILTFVATKYAQLLMMVRWIEIYLFYVFSPLPMATLADSELSQIGKGFLRNFAAKCFHGTVLYMVLKFFPLIYKALSLDVQTSSDVISECFKIALYAVAMVVSISASNRWAKTITGAQ